MVGVLGHVYIKVISKHHYIMLCHANSSHLTFKAYQTYIMSNTVSLYQTYKLIPCFRTCEGSLTAKEISARLFEIPSHVHGIDLGMHTNYSLGTRIEHGININKNAQL